MRALLLGNDRTLVAFAAANRRVAVEADDQFVPQSLGFAEQRDMSDMQNVKKTIGKNDGLFWPGRREERGQFLACQNFP